MTVIADDEGRVAIEGFAGQDRVRVGQETAVVDLDLPGTSEREVAIGRRRAAARPAGAATKVVVPGRWLAVLGFGPSTITD
jgi:hypothetical protein